MRLLSLDSHCWSVPIPRQVNLSGGEVYIMSNDAIKSESFS